MGKAATALAAVLLLSGCSLATPYVEVSGNIQQRTGSSDWVLVDGYGKARDYVGQVSVVAGLQRGGLSVFAGLSHLSMPEYGHDRGFNALMTGVSYRHAWK